MIGFGELNESKLILTVVPFICDLHLSEPKMFPLSIFISFSQLLALHLRGLAQALFRFHYQHAFFT
jgi:hypothetical protein